MQKMLVKHTKYMLTKPRWYVVYVLCTQSNLFFLPSKLHNRAFIKLMSVIIVVISMLYSATNYYSE